MAWRKAALQNVDDDNNDGGDFIDAFREIRGASSTATIIGSAVDFDNISPFSLNPLHTPHTLLLLLEIEKFPLSQQSSFLFGSCLNNKFSFSLFAANPDLWTAFTINLVLLTNSDFACHEQLSIGLFLPLQFCELRARAPILQLQLCSLHLAMSSHL